MIGVNPRLFLLALLALQSFLAPAMAQTPVVSAPSPVFTRYAVAAANPLAAEAGLAVLKRNGSAIDAAIAVQMVLNVVEPQASGIGGGGLLLYWDAKARKLHAYDGRETAPKSATPDLFMSDGKPMGFREAVVSAKSVGVPGALRLLHMVHRAHGRLPWASLFDPAIALARDGAPIQRRLANALAGESALQNDPAARALFFDGDGKPRKLGEMLANPALAAVLEKIAADGADTLYRGDLAQAIVDAVNRRGADTMSLADLADYAAKEREPVCAPYRVWQVCGFPPPSSGGIAIAQALGILEQFDMAKLAPNSPAAAHFILEANRLAFADRNRYVADGDFVSVPLKGLLDRAYLRERAQLISPEKAMADVAPGKVQQGAIPPAGISPQLPGTSHMAIVDGEGNVLSFTTTIEAVFGARLMVQGFLLNNELTDFSFLPERDGQKIANQVEPGKRPRSSMSPTIVFDRDGKPVLAIGSAGGATIIGATLKTIIGVLDWQMPVQQAIDLPNLWNVSGASDYEATLGSEEIVKALRNLGHAALPIRQESGLHGIRIGAHGMDGGADPRRDGAARGE